MEMWSFPDAILTAMKNVGMSNGLLTAVKVSTEVAPSTRKIGVLN